MFLYENIDCPVCKRRFEEGDDVVVCPDCGTPHHRECWQLSGRCVNSGLHSTGYNFHKERKQSEAARTFTVPVHQEEEENTSPTAQPLPAPLLAQLQNDYSRSTETVGGKQSADIAAVVGTNIPRFMQKFKKFQSKGGLSWNWGAFFFGSLYLFYRKMYRYAALFISAVLALFCLSDYLTIKLAPKAVAALQEAMELASAGSRDMTAINEKMLAFQSAADFKNAAMVTYLTLAAILVVHIIAALLADRMYQKQVFGIIDSVDNSLEDGAVLQTPFMSAEDFTLNKEQMRRLYLARRGGVTVFAPFAAFMAFYLLISFI